MTGFGGGAAGKIGFGAMPATGEKKIGFGGPQAPSVGKVGFGAFAPKPAEGAVPKPTGFGNFGNKPLVFGKPAEVKPPEPAKEAESKPEAP